MWVPQIIIGLACVIVYYLYTKWKAFHEVWDYMEKCLGQRVFLFLGICSSFWAILTGFKGSISFKPAFLSFEKKMIMKDVGMIGKTVRSPGNAMVNAVLQGQQGDARSDIYELNLDKLFKIPEVKVLISLLLSQVSTAENLVGILNKIRKNASSEFIKVYVAAEKIADAIGAKIEEPRVVQRQKHLENYDSESPEEYFRNKQHFFAKSVEWSLKYPGLFKMRTAYTRPTVWLYNPEDIEKLTNNMAHISKGQLYELGKDWLGTGLVASTGSKWHKMRKIITPAFHFSILNEFLKIFNRETEHLVKVIKAQPSQIVDVVAPITKYTLSSIGETSLGVQMSKELKRDDYQAAVSQYVHELGRRFSRPWLIAPVIKYLFPSVRRDKETVAILHDFSNGIIQNRKKELEADIDGSYSTRKKLALLDKLLNVRYKEGIDIDDDCIRQEVDTFMFAGHDTTAVCLCWSLLILANEPKIQEEIYHEIIDIMGDDKKAPDANDIANMVFLERCVKEILRLYPSAPAIARTIGEDFKTRDGYIIKKGSEVNIFIYGLHHSPAVWENPEKFDPDRFLPENIASRDPYAYVPFSAGPRNCIGQRYALYEVKAALCGVLRNFRLEPVDKRADVKMKLDIVLRSNDPMRVKFVPRK